MTSYTQVIAKLFVPADTLKNTLTILPHNYSLSKGKPFQLYENTYYSIENRAMELASELASKIEVKDNLQFSSDPNALIKSFRKTYKTLLSKRILGNNDSMDIFKNSSPESNSDLKFLEFLTCGPGSLLVKREESKDSLELRESTDSNLSKYVVDVSDLYNYPVREGYIRYGGKVSFDKDRVYSIEVVENGDKVLVLPSDDKWNYYKFLIKSSIIVYCIVRVHACQFHIKHSIVAQAISSLDKGNKIYELMAPFLYKNLESSEAARAILLGEGRYFHRLFSFTYEGLDNLVRDSLKDDFNVDYSSSMDLPFYEDARLVSTFFSKYVTESGITDKNIEEFNSVSDVKSQDISSVTNVLVKYLCDCTMGHECVGNTVLKWQYDPLCSAAKLVHDSSVCDAQTYEQTMLIGVGTVMNKVPMLIDVVNEKYKSELKDISVVISERNDTRVVKCHLCDPLLLESTFSQ